MVKLLDTRGVRARATVSKGVGDGVRAMLAIGDGEEVTRVDQGVPDHDTMAEIGERLDMLDHRAQAHREKGEQIEPDPKLAQPHCGRVDVDPMKVHMYEFPDAAIGVRIMRNPGTELVEAPPCTTYEFERFDEKGAGPDGGVEDREVLQRLGRSRLYLVSRERGPPPHLRPRGVRGRRRPRRGLRAHPDHHVAHDLMDERSRGIKAPGVSSTCAIHDPLEDSSEHLWIDSVVCISSDGLLEGEPVALEEERDHLVPHLIIPGQIGMIALDLGALEESAVEKGNAPERSRVIVPCVTRAV